MAAGYVLDSSSDLGGEQLGHLEALYDPPTKGFLDQIGVHAGWRCLDLGAGSGSITRRLAEQVGPDGRVFAVDIDTEHLTGSPGVTVYRHDIRDGLPVEGTFDLIHARLVLMHLPQREQIFKTLVDALAPGGWLVLAESLNRPQQVLDAPSEADAELATRVVDNGLRILSSAGVSWQWAHEVEDRMAASGLTDIRGLEYCPMVTGGDAGGLLYENYAVQLETPLLRTGITEDETARFRALMHDPGFRAWSFQQLVFTAGRKPTP